MDGYIGQETRELVIRRAAELLEMYYLFPETGKKLAEKIQEQLQQGKYDEISKPSLFGAALHSDLREIIKDGHLHLYYHPQEAEALEQRAQQAQPGDEDTHWWEQRWDNNFGLKKAEVLVGNIGYLDIHVFAPVFLAAERIAAAIGFLSDCSALIFDLRQCSGGDPYTVQLLESYLFPPEPLLLHTLEDRFKKRSIQIWTLPHVPGKRMPDAPVYILTSAQTFSGGEDFSYTLKHHQRARIVGETSKGGAHIIEFLPVGKGFVLVVPTGQPIHPVTGSNWEGTGVEPDINVPKEHALETAHLHALKTLATQSTDKTKAKLYQAFLRRATAIYNPLNLSEKYMRQLIGVYGSYQAIVHDGVLMIESIDQTDRWEATPLTQTLFKIDEDYDGEFELNEQGEATAFTWLEIRSGRKIKLEKKIETPEI